MFKAARWRTEKTKTKVVFKLQFYAVQIPPTGTEAAMVSLIPADANRPTARTDRVAAVEGACSWGSPVYETVKLVRNPKTGKVDEKVYRLVVSAAGSIKTEILGEASIDMANYAEVFRASSVALPLKGSNTGAILHIIIQRMQGDGEGREGEEDGGLIVKRQRRTLESQLSKCDDEDGSHIKNQAQVKFSSSRNMPVNNAGYNGDLQKSHSFDAVSISGSDTSSGIYTPRENGMKNNNMQKDPTSFLSPLINSDTPKLVVFSSDDFSATSAPDRITDASTNSPGDAGSNETSRDSEDSIEKLKSDIDILTRKLQVSVLELQTLRKQIIKENKRVQDLSSDLSSLKEERDALKRMYDELKLSERRKRYDATPADMQHDGEDNLSLLGEIREELDCEKNLNVHLRLQLKMTQEANSELLLALKDLDGMLEQRNKELLCVKCSEIEMKTKTRMEIVATKFTKLRNVVPHLQKTECEQQLHETQSDNEEQYALDALVNERDDSKTAYSMDNKILDLNTEVEFYRREREDLEMQMEQLALDYEILKQENHDIRTKLEQMQLREQLRMQYECSAHLAVISDLESRVEFLELELEKQAEAFETDIETITLTKVELEKRAILAEEELRKTKWNHSNTVDRLQEELRSLSARLSSTFEENEKIVMQTLKENAELRAQRSNLVELLEKSNKELAFLQDKHRVKFKQLAGLMDFKSKEADRLLHELNEKKRELENYKMSEEARRANFLEELHLLKTEAEKLKLEKFLHSKEKEEKEKLLVEMNELRTLVKGSHIALQEKELEIELLKKEKEAQGEEVGKLLNEINDLSHMKDDKNTILVIRNPEEAALGVQYNDMNQALCDNELEKNNISKSISHSKDGFLEGEQITTNWVENTDDNCTTTNTDDHEQFYQNSNCGDYHEQLNEDKVCIHEMNGAIDKELEKRYSDLDEGKQVILSCSYERKRLANVLSEMDALKEQNKSMESQLNEMQERYSEISLKFAEVEGERQQLLMTIRSLKNSLKC